MRTRCGGGELSAPRVGVKTLAVGTQCSECLPSSQFFIQCWVLKVGLGSFVLDFFLVEGKTVARAWQVGDGLKQVQVTHPLSIGALRPDCRAGMENYPTPGRKLPQKGKNMVPAVLTRLGITRSRAVSHATGQGRQGKLDGLCHQGAGGLRTLGSSPSCCCSICLSFQTP